MKHKKLTAVETLCTCLQLDHAVPHACTLSLTKIRVSNEQSNKQKHYECGKPVDLRRSEQNINQKLISLTVKH